METAVAKVLAGSRVRRPVAVAVAVAAVAAPAVAVAPAVAPAANSPESREGGWPATRVEGNIGRSSFESHRRLFAIG